MADGIRLSGLLPDRLNSMAERVKTRLSDSEEVGGMRLAWGYIGKEIQGALKSALDCDLLEILGKAWAQASPLVDFSDPNKHPPGERTFVELSEHKVGRDLHPVIAISLGALPSVELRFTFAVTAHVGGVRLAILDNHIIGGDLGEAWASAQLSYEGTPLHPASRSTKVAFPGAFHFAAPGIEIPRLGVAA